MGTHNILSQIITASSKSDWASWAKEAGHYTTKASAMRALESARAVHEARRQPKKALVPGFASERLVAELQKLAKNRAGSAALASRINLHVARGIASPDPTELTVEIEETGYYADGYWGSGTWYNQFRATVTLGVGRAQDVRRAIALGDRDGSNLRLIAVMRDDSAIWVRPTRSGPVVEQGWVFVADDGSLVHSMTREDGVKTLARRNKTLARGPQPKRKPRFATFAMARRLGFCATGIHAWCAAHGVDPNAKLSAMDLRRIDPDNDFVRRLLSHMS